MEVKPEYFKVKEMFSVADGVDNLQAMIYEYREGKMTIPNVLTEYDHRGHIAKVTITFKKRSFSHGGVE